MTGILGRDAAGQPIRKGDHCALDVLGYDPVTVEIIGDGPRDRVTGRILGRRRLGWLSFTPRLAINLTPDRFRPASKSFDEIMQTYCK